MTQEEQEQVRQAMSILGRSRSEEKIKALNANRAKRVFSAATRQRMSEAQKLRWRRVQTENTS